MQTIAFLCTLRKRGTRGPFLVVGPLSTLPNWVAEFERWAPDFPVVLYHGSKQERQELRRKRMPAGTAVAVLALWVCVAGMGPAAVLLWPRQSCGN